MDNPQAFPGRKNIWSEELKCNVKGDYAPGMTLRDYFAGQALAGLIYDGYETDVPVYAKDAYEIADAMLEERNKT